MRTILITLLSVFLILPAFAQTEPDALEDQAREIGKSLRCVVCQNQSIEESDADLARRVIQCDDAVDENNLVIITELKRLMKEDSSLAEPALHCFSASRHIERIADLAENIAEDVIYLVDGDIVRHQHGNFITEP